MAFDMGMALSECVSSMLRFNLLLNPDLAHLILLFRKVYSVYCFCIALIQQMARIASGHK